jgi:hypothetical protein
MSAFCALVVNYCISNVGVPPHTLIGKEIAKLITAMESIREEIDKQPDVIASLVCSMLRDNFTVDGVTSASRGDVNDAVTKMMNYLDKGFARSEQLQLERAVENDIHARAANYASPQDQSWWVQFPRNDGGFPRFTPSGFVLNKKLTIRALAKLFYFGEPTRRIRPYRHLRTGAFGDFESSDDETVSRMYTVMKRMAKQAEPFLQPGESVNTLTLERHTVVFEEAAKSVMRIAYGDKIKANSRKHENCFCTIAGQLTDKEVLTKTGKMKKRFRTV